MSKNEKIILVLIIFLASVLRLVALDKIPLSFHHDELLSAYEAYSISTTNHDQWGNFLPLRFKAFGDWVPPLYFYYNVPFVLILGLSEWAIRLPAAILGILTVLLTFFLTKELFKNRTIALLAAFLMAISPWHIHYSRLGWPAIMVPFLITLGLWLFFAGLNNNNKKIYLGVFFVSLSVWAYAPAQVFTPLLLFGLLFFNRTRVERKVILTSILVSLSVLLPLFFLTFAHPEWQTRFNQISLLQATKSPFSLIFLFLFNYFSHLSPTFLFIAGDANLRHNVASMGQIYFWESFLIFFIAYLIVTKGNKKIANFNFLLYWLFIFPVASALTIDGIPHASRTITALPLLHIFSALGLFLIVNSLRKQIFKKSALTVITVIVIFSFGWFAIDYYKFYPKYSASWFGYGQKEMVEYVKENYNHYEKIIIGEKHPLYLYPLFYFPFHPEKFHTQVKTEEIEGIVLVKTFDKFEFRTSLGPIKENKFPPKTLYIDQGKNELPLKIKKMIYFPDGSIAYRIMASE